ncbi:UDP-N-acetylmuramate dehydrogenase [Aliibacillus thermotolerans]|uniref:UDP-N-acetylenolpyruvoylglucosamine reductase n=1 Tax=Aliibacillus thermotolerans TaxID=1834418 RepID=A0ABW0U3W4_9BACI|nr:UDP-N-acetylmuramate dehydrogenase [Aliibacillus thermotolerans]MDA3131002.1 UDP-N-acetylmuramate dehydrogenase [Aliibacillus thermotolerans]
MQRIVDELKKANVGSVRTKELLKHHTTWKIGGPADIFVEPDSVEGLVRAMEIIQSNDLPWRAIGRGSNLLVDDRGIEGVVFKIGKHLDHLEINDEVVRVGAGFPLVRLATVISMKGLSGLEFAGGIPGSVGGAVFMNAGAHGSDMSQILLEARILYPDGRLLWLSNKEMDYSYRTSCLQKEKGICVEARLQLKKGEKETVVKEMKKHKEYRRETQPWDHPCAGSVFRNPLPHHAGALIEKAGLKGFQIGGAQISPMHGNFIVNVNEASASDVLALIQHAQKTVKKEFQIELQTEVEIVTRSNS